MEEKTKSKNELLYKDLERAVCSDGYLVMITRLNGERLTHTYFMERFRKGDIRPSLNEYGKLLEPETK